MKMSRRCKTLIVILTGFICFTVTAAAEPHIPTLKICDPMAHIQCIAVTAVPEKTEEEPIIEEPKTLTTEELIIRESEAAGIDPNVAVAISRLETGHWTSYAYVYCNNVGGLSDNEVPRSYATVEDGVKAFVNCLVTYWEKGLTTPELMESTYCPLANGEWAANVRALMGGM